MQLPLPFWKVGESGLSQDKDFGRNADAVQKSQGSGFDVVSVVGPVSLQMEQQ